MAVGVKELATKHALKTVKNPCTKECGERAPGCYSQCARRKEYMEKFEAERARVYAAYEKENGPGEFLAITQARRKTRRKD